MATAAPDTLPPPPRVVLDTNVVLSALVFSKGVTAGIRGAWQAGACLPLVSTATVQELMRALAYPKSRLDAQERAELLADYLPFTEVVSVPQPPPVVPRCRDSQNLPFLFAALVGRAQWLVTGDADLLVLGQVDGCEIVTPEVFRVYLGRRCGP